MGISDSTCEHLMQYLSYNLTGSGFLARLGFHHSKEVILMTYIRETHATNLHQIFDGVFSHVLVLFS